MSLAPQLSLDLPVLEALATLKAWAEDREAGGYHHTVIVGKVLESFIDTIWLEQAGYKLAKGDKETNMPFWHHTFRFPGVSVRHAIHANGTWTMQVTPKLVQVEPAAMMRYAQQVLTSAFSGANSFHVVVRRFEASRSNGEEVLAWMKQHNIKEIKCYVHDSYEARVEVTYLDPAFSPKVANLIAYLG